MADVSLAANTRQAVVLRVVLGVLVGVPVTALAFLLLAWASPMGVVFAVPAGYLLHAAVKDGLTLLRRSTPEERPRFLWFALAGVVCIACWSAIFWA